MEVSQRLGVVIDLLHVTELRQQPPVPHHSTVLTLTVREYHLQTQKLKLFNIIMILTSYNDLEVYLKIVF